VAFEHHGEIRRRHFFGLARPALDGQQQQDQNAEMQRQRGGQQRS
jgi:hypothetical protein